MHLLTLLLLVAASPLVLAADRYEAELGMIPVHEMYVTEFRHRLRRYFDFSLGMTQAQVHPIRWSVDASDGRRKYPLTDQELEDVLRDHPNDPRLINLGYPYSGSRSLMLALPLKHDKITDEATAKSFGFLLVRPPLPSDNFGARRFAEIHGYAKAHNVPNLDEVLRMAKEGPDPVQRARVLSTREAFQVVARVAQGGH